MTLPEATVRALGERAEELDAARLEYRELCAQHALAGGLKVGYVTATPRLMVARDTYHTAADPTTIRAIAADWLAMRAVLVEVGPHLCYAARVYAEIEPGQAADVTALLARLDAVLTGGE